MASLLLAPRHGLRRGGQGREKAFGKDHVEPGSLSWSLVDRKRKTLLVHMQRTMANTESLRVVLPTIS